MTGFVFGINLNYGRLDRAEEALIYLDKQEKIRKKKMFGYIQK